MAAVPKATLSEIGTELDEGALQRAGVAPREALHVGNDPLDDVLGAKGAGLFTCLVDAHLPIGSVVGSIAPDLTLRSVAELPRALLGPDAPRWVSASSSWSPSCAQ